MPLPLNMLSLAINSDTSVLAIFILVILWACEHFLIQASLFDSPPITRHPLCYQSGRFAFNFLAAVFILSVVSLPWLLFLIGLDFLLSLVLIAYQQYFHKPLSPCTSVKNFGEGLKVAPFAIRIISPKVWLWMVIGLVVKWSLALTLSHPSYLSEGNARTWIASLSLVLILGMILSLQFTSFRFSSIKHTSMTRVIFAYGYLISWIADFFLSPNPKQLADEVAALQKDSPDRLASSAIPYEINHHVVVIQIESLDWNLLNASANGMEVMPFLNALAGTSQAYKVAAYHEQGTADMDYAVLSGGVPSKRMMSYSIHGLDYPNALPRFMHHHGFHTVSMHGATGGFFNRRSNFQAMGWDEILFREEFKKIGAQESYWGTRDQELFRHSSKQLNEARQPEFHYLITLDSHGPFNLITEAEKSIYPSSRNWKENYFNSMAAVDKNLEDYVTSLPTETVVVLYGDHTSGVHHEDFTPAREGSNEFVPCIVHQHPTEGSTTPRPPSSSTDFPEDLCIHDIINAIRRKIAKP